LLEGETGGTKQPGPNPNIVPRGEKRWKKWAELLRRFVRDVPKKLRLLGKKKVGGSGGFW